MAAGFVLALVFGLLAHRLRFSPIVGYLLAGALIGPFTPGFVADQTIASELAEIGVILLMFGVGLHFSLADLVAVRRVAVIGGLVQIAVATALGAGLGALMGWTAGAGLVFGLALSVASTVVLLRTLGEFELLGSLRGRIAIGWLVVEDLAMVLALVLIPAVNSATAPSVEAGAAPAAGATGAIVLALGIAVGKIAAFVAFMLVAGRKLVPWMLQVVADAGSPELFRLAILALSLGTAFFAASLFDVSFALGAFFAGMMLNETPLGHRAAEESLPLRDAFAVLFFVAVGMLFDWTVVLRQPWELAGTVFVIVLGKSLAAYALTRMLGHDRKTAGTIAASLAQIGEFSFILAGLGVSLKLLPEAGRDLVLGGAIISILLNPLLFRLAERATVAKPAVEAA
jgi:CPA2 family monovalent cation:H+ antiporter-2